MKKQIEVTPGQMETEVESWNLPTEKEHREYTVDQMIHAYTTGINVGMEKDEKLFQKQIQENSKLAALDTFKVIDHLKWRGFNPISAHLRIGSRYSVEVLITVSDADFAKDSFSEVYKFVTEEIQTKGKTDFYSITFSFINRASGFDLEMVESDGFISSFKPLEEKK